MRLETPFVNGLEVSGIRKRYGGVCVLEDVSFSMPIDGRVGLIGPNGAGKSTLFATITGLVKPDTGEAKFVGTRLNELQSEARARLGMGRTFQVPRPFGELTVRANLACSAPDQEGEKLFNGFFPRRWKDREAAIQAEVEETARFIGLNGVLDNLAAKLSGGQLKLLELGRALMTRPKFILLDEPFAGVNPVLIQTLSNLLKQVNERGIGLLIIEHNIGALVRLVPRLMVMDRGHLVADGASRDVLEQPLVREAYLGVTK